MHGVVGRAATGRGRSARVAATIALALAAGLVLLASAPAANAGSTNYCDKNRVQHETCWARDAAGNLDNHTYNNTTVMAYAYVFHSEPTTLHLIGSAGF